MTDSKNERKTVILIGRSTAGKTTLCQCINNEELTYHKTQTIQVVNQTMIDTPGEYLQRMYFRGALMVTAADADMIIFVQDATDEMNWFPPAYNTQFTTPAIGVVTKADIARGYLEAAGAEEIFVTSSVSGEGIRAFLDYLGYTEEDETE